MSTYMVAHVDGVAAETVPALRRLVRLWYGYGITSVRYRLLMEIAAGRAKTARVPAMRFFVRLGVRRYL